MFARLFALILIFVTTSLAMVQPVMHEVVCPSSGWIARTFKVENTDCSSCCSGHVHSRIGDKTTAEFTLVIRSSNDHCDGECIAIVLENSSSHQFEVGEWANDHFQDSVAIHRDSDCLIAIDCPRSRGPPVS